MSHPMTATQLVAQFKKWQVPVHELPGWRKHDRNHVGPWGEVYGTLLHHTGDDAPDDVDTKLLWGGRPGLPGPLCTWGMRDDGFAVMMSAGRSNHAGPGSSITLKHVQNEDYGDVELKPGMDDIDGNTHYYGQETMYSGGHEMTILAYRSTVRAHAAIDDFHGWTGKSNIGHREHSRRKIDPGSLNMAKFRKDVDACLAAGPGNWPVKEPLLRKDVTKIRTTIKDLLKTERSPMIRKALMAADRRLAKIERR